MTSPSRAEQLVALVLFLFPGALILGLIWIVVKLSDPKKPVFFAQPRVGIGGKHFPMWKVRTMDKTDYQTGKTQTRDPRVTRIGRILRRCHVDEVIQLINVVNGSMSFIGPRPTIPEIAVIARQVVPSYDRRHRVLPGLTGLKQINGRCNHKEEHVFDRLLLMKMHNPGLKAWIIYRTFLRVFTLGGE